MSELKPCPFCGMSVEYKEIVTDGEQNAGDSNIQCWDCNVSMRPTVNAETKEQMIIRWNNRSPNRVETL